MEKIVGLAFGLTLTIVGLLVFSLINALQGEPYMDEIFHVPQAQKYCHGNFSEWDPMITTLPGLYLLSAMVLVPMGRIFQVPVSTICSVSSLRSINLGFMLANVFVLYMLSCTLHGKREKVLTLLNAFSIGLFPVLYLFNFLYYTDPGSVFWVLLMYFACLKKANKAASICGVVAVLFRQTNIVWVVFVAGLVCEEDIMKWIASCQKQIRGDKDNVVGLRYVIKCLTDSFISNPKALWCLVKSVVPKIIPYGLIVVLFMTFIYMNNGLVLGDRSHHQACMNFPQLYYFFCTCMAFQYWHMSSLKNTLKCINYIIHHPFIVGMFFVGSAYIVANYTHVHEYLLADNRHYTFYVWSKIYRRHEMVRFLLIPVYFFTCFNFSMLLSHKSFFWKIVFSVCLFVSIVPQKLLEFRYFVIPFFIWRLNIQPPQRYLLLLEIISFGIINGITLYMFLYKPFKWPESDQQQRFMW